MVKSTAVQLQMFNPEISPGSPSAIFLQASPDGASPCVSLDGRMTGKSGQEAALASHLVAPVKEKEPLTNVTSGPSSTASSKRASRRSSSASKSHPQKFSERTLRLLSLTRFRRGIAPRQTSLQTNLSKQLHSALSTDGSMEYKLTWRPHLTPSGLRISRLRASERPTGDKDFGGWPTPNTPSGGRSMSPDKMDATGKTLDGKKHTASLEHAVKFSGQPTHQETDLSSTQSGNLNRDSHLAIMGWTTPSSRDWKDTPGMSTTGINPDGTERTRLDQLPRQANLAAGATPGTPAQTAKHGESPQSLNPFFSAWLMSYPTQWTLCGLRALDSLSPKKSRTGQPS